MNRIKAFGLTSGVAALISLCAAVGPAVAASSVRANEYIWAQFSAAERVTLLTRFPDLELVPMETVGTIQSAQLVDRSTPGSHSGAALGSVIGQAAYIDHAFKRGGSSYSAITQVGAALLGAAAGSSLDSQGQTKFLHAYGVRTADGQVREVRIDSSDEITRPVGQCVYLADMTEASPVLCLTDKVQFLKQLMTVDRAGYAGGAAAVEQRNKSVACRLPNVGLMTLELAACQELQGTIEK